MEMFLRIGLDACPPVVGLTFFADTAQFFNTFSRVSVSLGTKVREYL